MNRVEVCTADHKPRAELKYGCRRAQELRSFLDNEPCSSAACSEKEQEEFHEITKASPCGASGVSCLSEAYNLMGIQGPRRLRHETQQTRSVSGWQTQVLGKQASFVYWVQMNAVFCGSQALEKPPKSQEKTQKLDVDLSPASLKAGLDRLQTSPGECNICCGVMRFKKEPSGRC